MKDTYHNLEGFKRKSLQMGSVLGIPIRDQFKDIVDAVLVSQWHKELEKGFLSEDDMNNFSQKLFANVE